MNEHSNNNEGKDSSTLHPPLPPSKKELKDIIFSRLEALFGDLKSNIGNVTEDWMEKFETRIENIIKRYYLGYPELDLLEILDEEIAEWKEQEEHFDSVSQQLYTLTDEWILALKEKASSLPEEIIVQKNALITLQGYQDYPFDYKLDRDLIKRASERFPDVDIIEQIDKKIIWWQEHPDALKANKSVRIQLWEWFELQYIYQQKRKQKERNTIEY